MLDGVAVVPIIQKYPTWTNQELIPALEPTFEYQGSDSLYQGIGTPWRSNFDNLEDFSMKLGCLMRLVPHVKGFRLINAQCLSR